MDLRMRFDEDTANYDRWRPRYSPQLFADLIRYASLNARSRAIEIGIGTGQATEPVLATGCRVTAIELGEHLASYVAAKYRDQPFFDVRNIAFESFECPPDSIDLIYSATAFHWIPDETGYPGVYRMLRPGGTVALFWNRPGPAEADGSLHAKVQELYAKHAEGFTRASEPEENDIRYRRIQETLARFGFVQTECRVYHAERSFRANEYIALLNTYSDHRSRPPEKKAAFESDLRDLILSYGDRIRIHDTMDLHLARKPLL